MRFDISEDQQLLRDATRDFIAGECHMESARQLAVESDEGYSADHWAKLAELGYLGLVAGEQAGGQGMGAVELVIVAEEMGQTEHVHGREGRPGQRPRNEIGYHALRTGDNVGEHTIVFGMMGETIDLTVRGHTRDSYAYGALAAAKWVVNQKPGRYGMEDVLGF